MKDKRNSVIVLVDHFRIITEAFMHTVLPHTHILRYIYIESLFLPVHFTQLFKRKSLKSPFRHICPKWRPHR